MLTAAEAAKEVGKKKQTIIKAIKTGRLSAEKNESNQWQIDPAELFRVYPSIHIEETTKSEPENSRLTAEIKFLHEKIEILEDRLKETQEDRDHWRNQATGLLTDQREKKKSSLLSLIFK